MFYIAAEEHIPGRYVEIFREKRNRFRPYECVVQAAPDDNRRFLIGTQCTLVERESIPNLIEGSHKQKVCSVSSIFQRLIVPAKSEVIVDIVGQCKHAADCVSYYRSALEADNPHRKFDERVIK